ncbi:MAG TPA: MFS transporter [Capillimicrobium sp.]|nr:MFS transporter [Capillimicrobium sp.]
MEGSAQPAPAGAPSARKEALGRSTVLALVALCLATFLIANDFTALTVALPIMERELSADVSTVQWVINAYALLFGVLIVPAGRLADMLGRRRVFFVGAVIFSVFSTLAGAAPTVELLIAGRALMAIGGALMWPAVLGLMYQVLPESRQSLAGPLVLGVCGIGNAVGPLLGGVLTQEASWRWVLLINLPIAAIACFVTWRNVPAEAPDRTDERIDYKGVAALSLGLIALLFALDQAPVWGWGDPRVLGLLVLCVVGVAVFALVERGAGAGALIPRDVAANRTFVASCCAVLLMSATFFAILLYVPQIMQKLMGFSAVDSGLGFLPFMLVFSVFAFSAGPLYDRFGGRVLLLIGAALIPAGVLLLSLIGEDSGYRALVPGLVVTGVGVGLFYSTITTVAITALDAARASLAGGLVYMFQVAGGAIGLGLTTTIFTAASLSRVRSEGVAEGLSADQEHAVAELLSGTENGRQLADAFPGIAAELEQLARDAFTDGVHLALRVDTALALAGFVVVVLFVGRRRAGARAAGGAEPVASEVSA